MVINSVAGRVPFSSYAKTSDDANNYRTPGEYAVYRGYTTNLPSDAYTYGVIKVLDYSGSGDRIFQVYYSLDDANQPAAIHFRHTYHVYNQAPYYAWSNWRLLYKTNILKFNRVSDIEVNCYSSGVGWGFAVTDSTNGQNWGVEFNYDQPCVAIWKGNSAKYIR